MVAAFLSVYFAKNTAVSIYIYNGTIFFIMLYLCFATFQCVYFWIMKKKWFKVIYGLRYLFLNDVNRV